MSEPFAIHGVTPLSPPEDQLLAICEDCSLVSIWEPDGDDDHPHEGATGHEMRVGSVEDVDQPIPVPGGASA